MSTPIQGLRGTGEFGVDFRPKNYRELFTLLEPNGSAPFNALLAMANSESTDDPEFKNFRDEIPERTLKINMAGTTAAGVTALVIDSDANSKFVVTGALIVNLNTGEVMRASADSSSLTAITVERNIGGTTYTITDNNDLAIVGFAAQEGATSPTAVSFDAVVSSNYTQIFRTAFKVTNTLKSTYLRTGNKEDEVITKGLRMHMMDIERAMIWGKKHEASGSTAQPTRYTGGLLNSITTVIDGTAGSYSSGIISEDNFDRELIETIFAFGSKTKVAFIGARVASSLQKMGKDRWQPTVVEGTYGVSMTRYATFAGDLLVHVHPQFRQIAGMANSMLVVDFPFTRYRYLANRDTQLLRDRQANDEDAVKHEYLTECGLELLQDKVHAYIKNWTALA
tara:strand:+ start:1369 stop:2553 length:1185 start_codon:yes stop_codon:yes gene_type:complete